MPVYFPSFQILITIGLIILIGRALVACGYNVWVLSMTNVNGNSNTGDRCGHSVMSPKLGKPNMEWNGGSV